jgi:adenosylhomocysteine nucleosidase
VLGVIAALPAEARCLTGQRVRPRQLLRLGRTLAYVSGIGEAHARQAALYLLSQGAQALVSWGTAGALAPALRPGALVIPNCVVSLQKQLNPLTKIHSVDPVWHERLVEQLQGPLTICTGPMFHSQAVVATPEEKAELFKQTGAIAVDMESAAIAETAAAAGIPFMIIRGIVDLHSLSIPRCTLKALDAYGGLRPLQLWSGVLCHPTELRSLIRLAAHFHTALSSLRRAARIGGPRLCYL